jgi:hypothetical protein
MIVNSKSVRKGEVRCILDYIATLYQVLKPCSVEINIVMLV